MDYPLVDAAYNYLRNKGLIKDPQEETVEDVMLRSNPMLNIVNLASDAYNSAFGPPKKIGVTYDEYAKGKNITEIDDGIGSKPAQQPRDDMASRRRAAILAQIQALPDTTIMRNGNSSTSIEKAPLTPKESAELAKGYKAAELQDIKGKELQAATDEAFYQDKAKAIRERQLKEGIAMEQYKAADAIENAKLLEAQKKIDGEIEEIRNWKVDQGRAFKSPARKGLAVIASSLEALSQGFARKAGFNPGPATVMRTVEGIIDRDINAQLQSLANKKTALSQDKSRLAAIYRKKGDLKDAFLFEKAASMQDLEDSIGAMIAVNKGKSIQPALMQYKALAQQKRLQIQEHLAAASKDKVTKTQSSSWRETPNAGKAAALASLAQSDEKPLKELTQKDRDTFLTLKDMYDVVKRYRDSIKKAWQKSSRMGRVLKSTDTLSKIIGGTDEYFLKAQGNGLVTMIAKAKGEGKISDNDAQRYSGLAAKSSDSLEAALNKTDLILSEIRSKFKGRESLLSAQNWDTKGAALE